MKLKTVHFVLQCPISGAYSPRSITIGATAHKDWVAAMEFDPAIRGIWLTLEGSRVPTPEKGRHFVPMEQVLKMYPLIEEPVKAAVKKAG